MSDSPQLPNLDLIRMVQQGRMMHDAGAVPSEVSGTYWIEAKPDAPAAAPTPRAGFWLVETDAEHVDRLWEIVRTATRSGRLGYKSKVSTVPRRGQGGPPSQRVICVCTADREDAADVERVRAVLYDLSIVPARYE